MVEQALAVAVVQSLLKPMHTVGMEMSEFLRALVKDLPVQWQLPYVLIAFGIIILVLFLSFGYRLRTFFLAIEPSHRSDGVSAVNSFTATVSLRKIRLALGYGDSDGDDA